MTITEIFNLGNKFMQEGNLQTAVQMWQECIKINPEFGLSHYNLAQFLRSQNNLRGAFDEYSKFMDSPVTGRTLDLIPQVKQILVDIEKQLNPLKV